jgi:hypothetical protein
MIAKYSPTQNSVFVAKGSRALKKTNQRLRDFLEKIPQPQKVKN